MIFCKKYERKLSMRNRMTWLILVEINNLFDAVFRFSEEDKREEYNRLKNYLTHKLNLD